MQFWDKVFKGLLTACMKIPQKKTGKIDADYFLPRPNTVSRNITKYEAEAKQGLAAEIDNVISEYLSTAFTTYMTT